MDGPSPLVERLGGVGLARDGGGSVVYEKRDADGAVHVFASRLEHGNPLPPERVDAGQALDSSQSRVAVARDGRTLVTWVNDGRLWGAQRAGAAEPFSEPVQIYAAGSGEELREPSLGLSLHGAGYVTFTVAGGGTSDVRSAYFEDGAWSVHADPLDIAPASAARDSRTAVSADGSALALWTEDTGAGTRVFARRIVRTRLSSAPQQVSVDFFEGRAGGSADSASLDIEDDSSYAWVAWRQDFDDAGSSSSRVLMRRLRGARVRGADGRGLARLRRRRRCRAARHRAERARARDRGRGTPVRRHLRHRRDAVRPGPARPPAGGHRGHAGALGGGHRRGRSRHARLGARQRPRWSAPARGPPLHHAALGQRGAAVRARHG